MSSFNFGLFQVKYALRQILVRLVEDDCGWGTDGPINNVSIKALLLTFLKFRFFLINLLAGFRIILDLLLKEDPLAVFICSRETVKDITSVAAVIFVEALLQKIIDDTLVRQTDRKRFRINLRLIFKFYSFSGSIVFDTLDLCLSGLSFHFIDSCFDGGGQWIGIVATTVIIFASLFGQSKSFVNELFDVNTR